MECAELFRALQTIVGTSPRLSTSVGEIEVQQVPRTGCQASYTAKPEQFSGDGKGSFDDWLAAEGFVIDYDLGVGSNVRGYRGGPFVIEVASWYDCADPAAGYRDCPMSLMILSSSWSLY